MNRLDADRILALRKRLGLTQGGLAVRLGVSFATVNRWENGRTKPSALALRQLGRESPSQSRGAVLPPRRERIAFGERGTKLPEGVVRLFQEARRESISWQSHRAAIIERVLAEGDWKAVRWVRSRAGDRAVRATLMRSRGRLLSPKQLEFWRTVLDLPDGAVDEWIRTKRSSPWFRRAD